MSISSAMLAGVTGLVSNSSALAAISDNIANSNTIGYKRVGIDFTSLVNSGSTFGYAAGGVAAQSQSIVAQQGTLQATQSPTDISLSGNGFFVATGQPTGVTPTDTRFFTRAGSFTVDDSGFLKNSAGLYLQGWPADINGNVSPDSANLNDLTSINILQVANTAQPTNSATIQANLDADQTPNAGAVQYETDTALSPSVYDMALYAAHQQDPATNTAPGIKPDFSITIPVSDSKGGQRNLVVDFIKSSATPNVWHAEVRSDPAIDVASASASTDGPGVIAAGDVTFNSDGSINQAGTTLGGLSSSATSPPVATITLGASNSGTTPSWAVGLGAAAQTISLNLNSITQFSANSAVTSVNRNGTAFGSLSGVTIDAKGMVTAVFDNGSTRRIAQVAIATFPNPDGLKSVNGNAYEASDKSGIYTLKQAGQAGAGQVSPSSLEASTVDLSTEFTGLITTQRAYSASSKIITTADQMLAELLNIKQ